ncbi:MAG TPA: hypothetical protein VL354_09590, partial [Spirochaetia bacterium]|nr:hypothetical protein [Spirochaetia bacterium]
NRLLVNGILNRAWILRGRSSGATQSPLLKAGRLSIHDAARQPHVISAVRDCVVSILLSIRFSLRLRIPPGRTTPQALRAGPECCTMAMVTSVQSDKQTLSRLWLPSLVVWSLIACTQPLVAVVCAFAGDVVAVSE